MIKPLAHLTILGFSQFLLLSAWGEGNSDQHPVASPGTLAAVIEQLYGYPVLDWNDEAGEYLEAAAVEALQAINQNGVTAKRVNEVGNAVEPYVIDALRKFGFEADIPITRSGRHQSSGYPDVEAIRGNRHFYIEVKTYNPKNEDTSQRSFYLSPSEDPKVTTTAFHILIAFAMEPDTAQIYRARKVKLLDLFELPLNLKMEFNASNRDLYGESPGLTVFESKSN